MEFPTCGWEMSRTGKGRWVSQRPGAGQGQPSAQAWASRSCWAYSTQASSHSSFPWLSFLTYPPCILCHPSLLSPHLRWASKLVPAGLLISAMSPWSHSFSRLGHFSCINTNRISTSALHTPLQFLRQTLLHIATQHQGCTRFSKMSYPRPEDLTSNVDTDREWAIGLDLVFRGGTWACIFNKLPGKAHVVLRHLGRHY